MCSSDSELPKPCARQLDPIGCNLHWDTWHENGSESLIDDIYIQCEFRCTMDRFLKLILPSIGNASQLLNIPTSCRNNNPTTVISSPSMADIISTSMTPCISSVSNTVDRHLPTTNRHGSPYSVHMSSRSSMVTYNSSVSSTIGSSQSSTSTIIFSTYVSTTSCSCISNNPSSTHKTTPLVFHALYIAVIVILLTIIFILGACLVYQRRSETKIRNGMLA